jgi:glycosyltransferase involved in cell wall biosynthesis
MKKKLIFIFKDSWLSRIIGENSQTKGPADFLYGYNFLNKEKYETSFINLPKGEGGGLTGKICRLLELPFRKITRLGIALEAYPLFKKEIKAADIIFCTTDGTSLGTLFWKKLGFIKAEVIVLIQGLPEKINRFRGFPFIRGFISSLLKKAAIILTFTEFAQKDFIADFKLDKNKVKAFPFGADIDFWKTLPEIQRENFILSIGNDGNRDYPTLIDALPESIALKIITKRPIDKKNKPVEILTGISDEKVRELYNQTLLVAIPSIKLKNESPGQSTAMRAMACGRAVIIPRLPTMEEIFTDKKECLFYEPENAADLQEKIKTLLENKALRDMIAAGGRAKVLERFTCRKMAERLEKIILSINK